MFHRLTSLKKLFHHSSFTHSWYHHKTKRKHKLHNIIKSIFDFVTNMISIKYIYTTLLSLQIFSILVDAKDCACNPSFYAWQVDLSKTCDDIEFITTGIEEVTCSISPSPDPVVIIRSLSLFELGQNFDGVVAGSDIQPNIDLVDKEVHYSPSIVSTDSTFQPTPYGYKFVAVGETAAGDSVTLEVVIDFTNVCEMEPLFVDGNSFGWFQFYEAGSSPHIEEYCIDDTALPTPSPTSESGERCEGSSKAPKSSKTPKSSKSPSYGKGKGGKGKGSSKSPTVGKGKGRYSDSWTAASKGKGSNESSASSSKGKGGKGKGGSSSKVPKSGKGKGGSGDGCAKTKKGKTVKVGKGKGNGKGKGGKGKGSTSSILEKMETAYTTKSRAYKARAKQ